MCSKLGRDHVTLQLCLPWSMYASLFLPAHLLASLVVAGLQSPDANDVLLFDPRRLIQAFRLPLLQALIMNCEVQESWTIRRLGMNACLREELPFQHQLSLILLQKLFHSGDGESQKIMAKKQMSQVASSESLSPRQSHVATCFYHISNSCSISSRAVVKSFT